MKGIAMPTMVESLKGLVDNIQLLDKHFSPTTHRAIEAVAHGDPNYKTLLLGLAAFEMEQRGVPSDEAISFLRLAVSRLEPRPDIAYQLMDTQTEGDSIQFSKTLPDKVHSIAAGERKYDPTILLHRLAADVLCISGYPSETSVNVLKHGTLDLINWRKSFEDKS